MLCRLYFPTAGVEHSPPLLHINPHLLENFQMKIHRPPSYGTAARIGNRDFSPASQKASHQNHGRTHTPAVFQRNAKTMDISAIQSKNMPTPHRSGSQTFQNPLHIADIRNTGTVFQNRNPLCKTAAAITGSAAFLEPCMYTDPQSALPPSTRILSTWHTPKYSLITYHIQKHRFCYRNSCFSQRLTARASPISPSKNKTEVPP